MTLTVRQLIAELSKIEDQDLEVSADGCSQCTNPVTGLSIETFHGHDFSASTSRRFEVTRVYLNVSR